MTEAIPAPDDPLQREVPCDICLWPAVWDIEQQWAGGGNIMFFACNTHRRQLRGQLVAHRREGQPPVRVTQRQRTAF